MNQVHTEYDRSFLFCCPRRPTLRRSFLTVPLFLLSLRFDRNIMSIAAHHAILARQGTGSGSGSGSGGSSTTGGDVGGSPSGGGNSGGGASTTGDSGSSSSSLQPSGTSSQCMLLVSFCSCLFFGFVLGICVDNSTNSISPNDCESSFDFSPF